MEPKIIVHGGAWGIPDAQVKNHISGCRNAATRGYEALKQGCPAVEAVKEAIIVLENDSTFDAGKGAFLNAIGEVELDAIIIDGRNLKSGAVGAVKNIKNPILLADKIMEHPDFTFLVSEGAEKFAELSGITKVKTEDLVVGRELERLKKIREDKDFKVEKIFREIYRGTVGAVAIDKDGNLSAGTSTGGTPNKFPGRIGDVPIIGAGAYAENGVAAVSSTGWGESIMKVLLAKTAADFIEKGKNPAEAAKSAIGILEKKVNGRGGLIIIDYKGKTAFCFNTPRMAYAYITEDCKIKAGI